jgi:hypothetical protein
MTTAADVTSGHPILLGHRELQRIFPTIAENTIYRWNSSSGGRARQLPDPYRVVSGTPMWTEAQILTFAEHKNIAHDVDAVALEAIRSAQSASQSES